MITSMQLYWITRLDSFQGFCMFLISASLVAFIGAFVSYQCIYGSLYTESYEVIEERQKKLRVRWMIFSGSIFLVSSFLAVFIPSTKEMSAILIIPKIANSDFVETIPSEMTDLKKMAIDYLKDKMKSESGK